MNSDKNFMAPNDLPSAQLEPQVHPSLRTEVQPVVELRPQRQSQPQMPIQPEPVLHPALESRLWLQVEPRVQLELQQTEIETQPQSQFIDVPIEVPARPPAPPPISPEARAPVPVPAPVLAQNSPTVLLETSANVQQAAQGSNPVPGPEASTRTVDPSDAFWELQERGKLAASRVSLIDVTIDILVTTFKNKYALDKALEKRCAKLLDSAEFETTDKALKQDLEILRNSSQWVKENMQNLEECLHEKHRNVQIAGPLVDAKRERKKEEKQVRKIEEVARKIESRAMKRDEKQMKRGEKRMVQDAWGQLQQ